MTVTIPITELSIADINLSEPELWLRPDREGIFAKLRAEAPITFQPDFLPPPEMNMPQGPGYWAMTRYADVMHVSRSRDVPLRAHDHDRRHPARDRRVVGVHDQHGRAEAHEAPAHRESRGFTPRQIARRGSRPRAGSRDRRPGRADGRLRLRRRIAALQIICDMMGIPREDIQRIFELTNTILGVGDPEYVQTMEELMAAGMELFQYGLALADDRAANPRDDITSTLMAAEIEDETGSTGSRRVSSARSSFCSSSPATRRRNAISHGLLALAESRSARDAPTSKACPPRSKRSCVGRRPSSTSGAPPNDAVVGGQDIKAGDKVVMFYNSANRDERQFPDPFVFDVPDAERARRFRCRRSAFLSSVRTSPAARSGHVRGAVPSPA